MCVNDFFFLSAPTIIFHRCARSSYILYIYVIILYIIVRVYYGVLLLLLLLWSFHRGRSKSTLQSSSCECRIRAESKAVIINYHTIVYIIYQSGVSMDRRNMYLPIFSAAVTVPIKTQPVVILICRYYIIIISRLFGLDFILFLGIELRYCLSPTGSSPQFYPRTLRTSAGEVVVIVRNGMCATMMNNSDERRIIAKILIFSFSFCKTT